MNYVVTYTTPFGKNVITILEKEELGLLMVPCKVLFKSESFDEASEFLNLVTNKQQTM